MKPTRLKNNELWPDKLPDSFLLRAKQTIKFIEPFELPAIDCGENNPLKEMIAEHFSSPIQPIDVNFDREPLPGKYKTIFCFEVLEHLYNPLLFLENLRNALDKNGVIYLSTPYQFPQCLKAIHHFHEIPTARLIWLFKEAGLKIVKQSRATISGHWWQHIYGFRPILRYFQYTRLYKLLK